MIREMSKDYNEGGMSMKKQIKKVLHLTGAVINYGFAGVSLVASGLSAISGTVYLIEALHKSSK